MANPLGMLLSVFWCGPHTNLAELTPSTHWLDFSVAQFEGNTTVPKRGHHHEAQLAIQTFQQTSVPARSLCLDGAGVASLNQCPHYP